MKDSETRREIREAAGTTGYAIRRFLPTVVVIVVILVVLGFGLQSAGIINIAIKRETIKHSHQYVEGKSGFVTQLINEYYELGTGIAEAEDIGKEAVVRAKKAQRKAVLQNIHRQGKLIRSYQRPEDIQNFLDKHPL